MVEQNTRMPMASFDGLKWARNIRNNCSPLQADHTFIWVMQCMKNLRQFYVMFATNCFNLVKIVYEPGEWSAFASYLEEIQRIKESFSTFAITYVSQNQNTRAYSLARGAHNQPTQFVFIDTESLLWFTES